MKVILQTSRLYLREFQIDDAQSMFNLNNNFDVIKYTGNKPFNSVDEAKDFLLNYNDYTKNSFGRWAVIDKETHKFLGWCGLKLNEEGFVDIGFRFFKNNWNKGYATEAAKACLEYGFKKLEIKEIIGRAAKENVASIRVLEKLGMHYFKSDKCYGINDAVYYRITPE